MLLEILAKLIGLQLPEKRYNDAAFEGGMPEDDGHEYGLVDELAKADPNLIEDYCERVVHGCASYDELSKALPLIKRIVVSRDYEPSARVRVRNSLKKSTSTLISSALPKLTSTRQSNGSQTLNSPYSQPHRYPRWGYSYAKKLHNAIDFFTKV